MVRFVVIFFIVVINLSCFQRKTEYGNIRPNPSRFTIKPNSNDAAYKIIDTTKIYELMDVIDTVNHERMHSIRKKYLKFYANGRVGEFDSFNKDDIGSLNPKKAAKAYYTFKKELIIQFYFKHPQGGGLIKEKVHKVSKDYLELIGGNNLSKYKIIELPQQFLVYKPDW